MKKKGFTMVELLVAISIIAVLTAILVPNLMGARERAADAKVKSELNSVKTALRMYYNDHQGYPAVEEWDEATAAQYMKDNVSVDYEYWPILRNDFGKYDGFQLCKRLQAATPEDLLHAQQKCKDSTNKICNRDLNIDPTVVVEDWYVECAN